ncbi:hypothetical protein MKX01_017514 [Papaver californicum]|nr:hypothetical protein MKX01_017514 [Papaver californicum]
MMGMSKKKKTAKNWFTSVKNAFKSSAPISSSPLSKDYSLANKIIEEEHEIPEIVSLEHYPVCDSSSLTTTIDENNAEAVVLEMRDEDRRRSNHAIAMAVVAAEAAVLAAHEATKVSRFSSFNNRRRFCGYSKEEKAATKIQSHYKGYLARRALRALRGLVKLQALVRGHNVRKQAEMTMRCMQAIVRVQARTKADRLHLQGATSHENEKSKGKKRATETWNNSRVRQQARNSFSFEKEYSRSSQKMNKHEHYLSSNSMTIKNERALAYAYPYQDSVSNRQNSVDSYSDEKRYQGGWNLLDRWIDSQPWHRDKHVAALPESSYTTRTYNTDDDNASERTPNTDLVSLSPSYQLASERTADTDLVSLSPSYQLRFNPISNLAKLGINSAGSVPIRQRKQRVMVSVETENVNTPSYMAPTQSAKAKAKSAQNSLLSSSSSTTRIFLNDLSMSSSTDGIGIRTGTEVRTMNQLGPINSPSPTSSQKMRRLLKMGKPIKGVR